MPTPEAHGSSGTPGAGELSESTHFELWAAELASKRARRLGRGILRFLFEGAWLSGVVAVPDAHYCMKWFREGGPHASEANTA